MESPPFLVKLGASFPPPTTGQDAVSQERPDPAFGGRAAGPGVRGEAGEPPRCSGLDQPQSKGTRQCEDFASPVRPLWL